MSGEKESPLSRFEPVGFRNISQHLLENYVPLISHKTNIVSPWAVKSVNHALPSNTLPSELTRLLLL